MKIRTYWIFITLVILLAAWPLAGWSEDIKVPATSISSLQGGWNAVQNVTVYGITYPNAYTVNGDIDYVVSRKYRFFVAEVGVRDDASISQGYYSLYGNSQQILNGGMNVGEPLKLIRVPISDYVRFFIRSDQNIIWVNPCFIK